MIICRYIEWNTRVTIVSQNSITLYNEIRVCGQAVRMETFIIYDNVRSAACLIFSTASCCDCNPMDLVKEQLKVSAEKRRKLPPEWTCDSWWEG
jgi:hypothetical protein